ncbi:MAG: carboxypeptidase regulatory-like domain-containing protein, partial [Deltaproteobacteria bacterium]|nr:carboxypeptidase regulatory-like domain-containing protein [Deltaproteobacteria bacterium]
MIRLITPLPLLASSLFLLLASAPDGQAQEQGRDQRTCIVAMNRDLGSVSRLQARTASQCIRDEARGVLTVPVETCLTSDSTGRVALAEARTFSNAAARCSSGLPDFGFTGPASVNQAGIDQELALVHDLFCPDLDAGVILAGSQATRCQQNVTKVVQRCERTILKAFRSCKQSGLRTGGIVDAAGLEACFGADPRGRIARLCETILVRQVDRCSASPVAPSSLFPGRCASDDLSELAACLDSAATCRTCLATNEADGLAMDCDLVDDGSANVSCVGGVAGPTADARVITSAGELIEGPLARGRVGDFILENARIRAIVQTPQRNFSGGVGQFGGNLIDVDLVRAAGEPGRDLFEEWSFMINLENTAHYTSVVVLNDGSDGNAAIIRATGVDDLLDRINASTVVRDFGFSFPTALDDTDQPVAITTDYILEPAETAIRMETTVTNTSGAAIDLFLGDFLSPLGQEIFHPGYGIGEPLITSDVCDPSIPCDFMAYAGEGATGGVSYGYIHTTPGTTTFNTDGVGVVILGASALSALLGSPPNITLGAGASTTVTRYLAVGNGDIASIVDTRNRLKGVPNGAVSGQVRRGGLPVADAEVVALADPLLGPGNGGPTAPLTTTNVVSQFRTDASGNYSGTLPVGSYDLRVNLDGHEFGTPDPAAIVVSAGGVLSQDFTLPEPATLRVIIEDHLGNPIAGKVSVV